MTTIMENSICKKSHTIGLQLLSDVKFVFCECENIKVTKFSHQNCTHSKHNCNKFSLLRVCILTEGLRSQCNTFYISYAFSFNFINLFFFFIFRRFLSIQQNTTERESKTKEACEKRYKQEAFVYVMQQRLEKIQKHE